MKIPCAGRLAFVVCGLSFLRPALTNMQFQNMTLIATALILGSKFHLTEISRMRMAERCVSTLSHFLSDAKFSTWEMQQLYALRVLSLYEIRGGYFIIDDTMKHHTNFCKWIHGVCILFDHVAKTNIKAVCLTVLYYSDGALIKFPICFRIYYQEETENKIAMTWRRRRKFVYKKKYELAVEMLEWAIKAGFPECVVLADSWFGIGPFVKELRRLKLRYVLEIKNSYNIKTLCGSPKFTKTGRLAKNQYDLTNIVEFFRHISSVVRCGFASDRETAKKEKTLYHTKIATTRLNSIPGKHRIIQSCDPVRQTVKYLITNELTWEPARILTVYSFRWVIEEFFRNAKQLSDMEGATVRSEQGVTTALCLVFRIDFLLHYENCMSGTAEELPKESLTIPSIVRRAQYENLEAFAERVLNEEGFVGKWLEAEKKRTDRKRKIQKELVHIEGEDEDSEQNTTALCK
ncbi:MAG: transposase [Desulfobacterales bacterium]|nr:transposase [Desulfobacterales bacterium]